MVTRRPDGVTRGHRCIAWIESNCVHTNGKWIGKPFRCLLWQKFIILALFIVNPDGLRAIRWALIGIAKKNGKTELCAALALFFAFGPSCSDGSVEPAALVVCAAGNDDQADLVFGAARVMAELSPTLRHALEVFEAEILCKELPGSKVRRVAAAAKRTSSTLDGKNIYVVICDELHCWEGPAAENVWNTLTNGTGARDEPLVLQITTAGFDLEGTVCGRQYEYGKAVAEGRVDDPRFFFWWVEAPEGCDYRDPEVIEAANPSFGVTVHLEFFLDQLSKKTEAVFRRYFLNQWTDSAESWLGFGVWEGLSVGPFEFDRDEPMWTGTDASTKHDSTAHVRAQWRVRGDGTRVLRLACRLWERPWDPVSQRPAESWKLPINEVENTLREYHRAFTLRSCGYDPALFERSASQLEDEGLPMEEVPQSDARMVPAAQALFQLIVEGRVEHDGDPDFARHMRNAVAVQARGGNGGWRLSKGKAKRKMDGAIAAAIATLLAVEAEEVPVLKPFAFFGS